MLQNIQILRAVAAIMVIIHHSVQTSNNYGYATNLTSRIENWGASGVDIFFVISGFIMVYIDNNRPTGGWNFIIQRFTRISPSYYFLTLVLASILLVKPDIFNALEFDYLSLFHSMSFTSIFLTGQNPILFVGWTIEYEMMFYVIFALSIALTKNQVTKITLASVIIIALILIGVSNIAINFITGMLIGLIYCKKIKFDTKRLIPIIFIIGIILHSITLFIVFPDGSRSLDNRLFYFGLSSAMIVFACLFLKQTNNNFITKIGDASYSIYLIQVFTIPSTYKLLDLLRIFDRLNGDITVIIATLISIMIGFIFYYLFEKPSIKLIRLILTRKFKHRAKGSSI